MTDYSLTKGIFNVFLIALLGRMILEVSMMFLFASDGVPWSQLFFKILWITGETISFFLLFDLLDRIIILRWFWKILLFWLVLFLILFSIADPIVVALAGDHLTPSLLAHFAGPQIFLSDELWLPIKENAFMVVTGLILAGIVVVSLFRMVSKSYRQHSNLSLKTFSSFTLIAALLMSIAQFSQGRFLQYPGEALYVRNLFQWDQYQPSSRDIENLQKFLGLPINAEAEYPLATTISSEKSCRPNIILIVIESLRASEFSLFHKDGKIQMQSFEHFAGQGVTYPYFISNGYPSTEGFMSLAMGIWPHSRERLVISQQDKSVPSLAANLNKQRGYITYRIEDHDDPEEEGFWIKPTFDHHITFDDHGIFPSEKNMVDTLISILNRKDSIRSNPVFVHLKTRNPHYPFEITDETNNKFYQVGSPSENYAESMKVIDLNLDRLFRFLEEGRWENILVIITGDHSNVLDKAHSTSLPDNETVWTGAIIAGDSNLIGNPRIDYRHASHVDISTTILKLVADQSAWIGFGSNLMSNSKPNYAIAVRPSGVRLDYNGYSHIVSRSNPGKYFSRPAFNGFPEMPEAVPLISSTELLDLVDTWTYLIEENRIFPGL